MFEVARYEGERRLVLGVTIAAAAGFYGAMFVALAPSLADFDIASLLSAYPDQLTEGLGLEAMDSLAGILAVELYQIGWLLVLGLYLAYNAASMVAGDVETGRMDTLLAAPVSRGKIITEEFFSLLVPILAVNAITPAVIYVAAGVINEPISVPNLVALHALAVPYLLFCAAVGLAFSVFLGSESLAQRGAIGVLVVSFLVETVFVGTDYEDLGVLTPMNYFDPTEILVDGSYDIAGAGILLAAALALVLASQLRFRGMDI